MLTKPYKILLCFATIFFAFQLSNNTCANHLGFGFDNEKKTVKIPFKSYDNLIIIEAVLDGKNRLNLILDTGIRSLVLFEQASVPNLSKNTFNLSFSGAGDLRPMAATVSVNHNLRLSDDVVANQINVVILNKSNEYLHKLRGIKIHGAFGYQLFSRFQVTIDYKNKIITLKEPFETNRINGFESIPLAIHDTKPFINTQLNTTRDKSNKLKLMLDLGANHKILLHNQVKTKSHDLARNERIAEGLGGPIYGRKGVLESVLLGKIMFNEIEVLVPSKNSYYDESQYNSKKHGSIGGQLFHDSTITIDYVNGYLFIKKPRG